MELRVPALGHVPSYAEAIRRGWSATNEPSGDERLLAELAADPAGFVAGQDDPVGGGPAYALPDGTEVARLPSTTRWMWDGEFCGRITLRWRSGTTELPPTCLGHIGYSVVPWRRREGIATRALHGILPVAAGLGPPWVDLTTDADNVASQRVILSNGGQLVQAFTKPPAYGVDRAGLLFRVHLNHRAAID